MNVKVEAYLADKQREELAKEQARRERILREAGFASKVYSPHEQASQEFPHYDYDEMRYYKLVFDEVTDEEFALLERYAQEEKAEEEESTMFSNIGTKIQGVAQFFCWAGIALSILAGVIMMAMGEELALVGILTAVVGGIGSWIGSLFLYGFGELIVKATQIEKNTRKGSAPQ